MCCILDCGLDINFKKEKITSVWTQCWTDVECLVPRDDKLIRNKKQTASLHFLNDNI